MTDLANLKSRVSEALLKKVGGVTGVGLQDKQLTIYVEVDTAEVRSEVTQALTALNLVEPVQWKVTGKFAR